MCDARHPTDHWHCPSTPKRPPQPEQHTNTARTHPVSALLSGAAIMSVLVVLTDMLTPWLPR
ncbi:hypothetical protein BDZ97DRAFT_1809252 [Flammula alnicola]|nr:hypothetical protein BDZ97DRAFT_1809252 [Flammula alnicola]